MREELMTRQRANGTGSIAAHGSGWRLRWTMPDGTRRSLVMQGTKRAATARLAEIHADLSRGVFRDERAGKVTLEAFARDYLEARAADLAPGTLRNYRTLLRTMILPTFGRVAVGEISVKSVALWWARNAERPVNRRNAYFLLSSMMGHAVDWEVIQASPCRVKKAGRDVAKPRPTWSVEDFDAVLSHVPSEHRAALEVMFAGHLRLGELVALNGADYRDGMLTVDKQVTAQGATTPTKTGQARSVRLLARGIAAMETHPRAIGTAPLFRGPKGGRLPRATLRKLWLTACTLAGLENFHLHDLRHVSLTLFQHEPVKVIQARGGHASITASMRYQHVDRRAEDEAASRVDDALSARRRSA
jgi:integrase